MPREVNLQKQAARSAVRARLRSLCAGQRREWSVRIVRQLSRLPALRGGGPVLLYHALADEPDLGPLLLPDCPVAAPLLLPRCLADGGLELRLYEGPESLDRGAFGIMEPTGAVYTHWERIGVCVVPGVAFTAGGARLGRGRGYYDRLLSSPALRSALKVGVCFPCQRVASLPCEAHDVRMDLVCCGI